MKYLTLGQGGWLAQKFNNFLSGSEISEVDILDLPALRRELDGKRPEVVLNCAGITGRPNIDWCEDHKEETIAGNVTVPLNILQACFERNVYWVHFGSGCIFQGKGPSGQGFLEDDEASPPSFYSQTKYWVDEILKNFPVLILRLRLPVDSESNPRNLIDKLVKHEKVWDPQNSITVIPDLLNAAKQLIEKRRLGIYHIVNPGTIGPAQILELYQKIVDPQHKFKKITVEDFYKQKLGKAVRSNCILNTEKLQKEGIVLKPIKERLVEIMEDYKKNLKT